MTVAHCVHKADGAAGESAFGVDQSALTFLDAFAIQREPAQFTTHGGHGIADQEQASGPRAALCEANTGRVHVVAIGNNAQPVGAAVQGRPGDAGFPCQQWTHRIEQVGKTAESFASRRLHHLVAGIAVAGEHGYASLAQCADLPRGHHFGCDGEQAAQV